MDREYPTVLYRDGESGYGFWARSANNDFGFRLNDINENKVRAFGIDRTNFKRWTLITAVVDREQEEVPLYENDTLVTTVSATELDDIHATGRLGLGRRPWDEQNAAVSLDNIRIFSTALDEDRIEALYQRSNSSY